MIWDSVLLALGFGLLIRGGSWLVSGASTLARAAGVSDLVVGLTVVAFGTSMPEFAVSLFAGLKGNTGICIGNVVGSNIANILLILGISALVYPLFATRGTVWKEIPFMLLATMVLAVQANDILLDHAERSFLSRGDGMILLAFFAIFLYYIAELIRGRSEVPPDSPTTAAGTFKPLGLIGVGLALLFIGGNLVVVGAVGIATRLGVSENLIGLTIVAVGTSLPELATSVTAAYKRNAEIAVGNIVGSNIFNILFILGVTSVAAPVPFEPANNSDVVVMIVATLLLFLAMFTGKPRHQLQRLEGAAFLALYGTYVVWLIKRG